MLKSLLKVFATLEKKKTKTWVRMYKQMKAKIPQSLPPNGKSMLQAIKRVNYEVYYWSRVDEAIINDTFLQDHGLIVDNQNEEVRPIMVHCYVFNFMFAFL